MRAALALFSYGGIDAQTLDGVMAEMFYAQAEKVSMLYSHIHGDALISRSRSKALSAFLASDLEVLAMVDHDLSWDKGDLTELCKRAHEKKCIVGGMYSNRAGGAGFSGRLLKEEAIKFGTDAFVDAQYISAGFTAYPRVVLEEILKNGGPEQKDPHLVVTECAFLDGTKFFDFARCVVVQNHVLGVNEFLSEDWSISHKAHAANQARPQLYWTKPMLLHWGRAPYSMLQSQKPVAPGGLQVKLH